MTGGPASVHALQAPQDDGAVLCRPPADEVTDLLQDNAARLATDPVILGWPLSDLRRIAREGVLEASRDYLALAGEPVPSAEGEYLLLAGHQPELVHPGVWLKHFALHAFARRHGAISLNLIVDNDTAKKTSLSVPAGERIAHLPFDRWSSEVPFEERAVIEEPLFESLPERASPLMKAWSFTPMLDEFWRAARRQASRTPLLGERFASARREFERRWGCHNLELPLSLACDSAGFAWFAVHLLTELPRLHRIYNAAVAAYRKQYGLRNRQHPVPDLGSDGDWREAPFWAWRSGQQRRHKLSARLAGTRLDLRAGETSGISLRLDASPAEIVAQWLDLRRAGFKIRSRALTTTLFARVFVGDLFIHGLGGAKYDEVTDAIIRDFYGIEPPAFMVVTGTLRLPLPRSDATEVDLRKIERLRRDVWWNPQRHLRDGEALDLQERKQRLIAVALLDASEKRRRYAELRQATDELRPMVREQLEDLAREEERLRRELDENAVAGRRDYAFCLQPEDRLRGFLGRLA